MSLLNVSYFFSLNFAPTKLTFYDNLEKMYTPVTSLKRVKIRLTCALAACPILQTHILHSAQKPYTYDNVMIILLFDLLFGFKSYNPYFLLVQKQDIYFFAKILFLQSRNLIFQTMILLMWGAFLTWVSAVIAPLSKFLGKCLIQG